MSSILSSRKDFLKGAFGLAALPAAGCAFGFAPSLAFWGDRIVCPDGAEFHLTRREA